MSTGKRGARTTAVQVQAMSGKQFDTLKESCGRAALAGLCGAAFMWGNPAIADLNKYEAAAGTSLPFLFILCNGGFYTLKFWRTLAKVACRSSVTIKLAV